MQARAADGTSGGVQGHVQPAGMQQMGMNQATDGRGFGFGVGMMDSGYAPRGDPAAAYAAMMQAQAAPAQFPPTQMQLVQRANRRYRVERSYDGSNVHEPWDVAE